MSIRKAVWKTPNGFCVFFTLESAFRLFLESFSNCNGASYCTSFHPSFPPDETRVFICSQCSHFCYAKNIKTRTAASVTIAELLSVYFLKASATATAQATVQPTIGLFPIPMKPIISTCAGTEEEPANCASECMRPNVSVNP